jgi:hypothetical protein
MIDWIECTVCETEYKLISKEPGIKIEFCPFCGVDADNQFTPEEVDDEDEEFDT